MNAVKVNGETVSTYTYNENRNLIERTDAEGNVYQFDYNADGQLVGQSDPEGAAFQYEYDANGRLSKTIDGNGNEIFREYGSDDTSSSGSACLTCGNSPLEGGQGGVSERLQRIFYPTFIKEFRYDEQGRVSEEMYTLNGGETYSVSFDYDAFGRLQSTTGPDGRSTTYVYDRMGRRIRVDDPSGQTQFEYDNWDNLIALTDAKDQRTAFEYDSLGRLKTEIRPMLQETTYEYYPAGSGQDAGRLWKILDAKNQMTEYGYDAQGRLETISYADGKTVTLNYDADGALAGYSDGETSAEYDYDDLGRKVWERVNYGAFSKEFSYTYYKNGLKKTFTGPDGMMYEYAYGNNNELREVRIPGLGAVTIPDYTWNRPTKMVFPGGTQRMYGYDALMRLKTLTVNDPGGNPLLDYAYTYNEVGNIMTKTTEHGEYGYGYDNMSRLISADNPVLDDEAYTYDNVGNRLTAADVSGSWIYNQNNELLGYADVEYDYDNNGNMTQIKAAGQVVWTYVYDAADRLKHVEDGTGTISADYYYDPFGRRLWKDVGGTRTYFFYSDEGLSGEYDASGTELRSYGYKPDSTWTTDPLWLKKDGQYYFYQNDHLGTPQKLTAVNGSVVWSAQYSSFGEADVQVETIINNLRFPGQYADVETGLLYNFHRYYNPKIGRYIQSDPVGFAGGDVNLYGYARNNPLKFRDSRGLIPELADIWHGWVDFVDFGSDFSPEELPEVDTLNALKGNSFSDHAARFMLMLYLYHDREVGKKPFMKDPSKYPNKRWTDCITYVERVLRYAYNMTGQNSVAKEVNHVAANGIPLARLLRAKGWKVIYWNPDVNHPSDGNPEHLEAWKNYHEEKHQYGGVIIDKNGKKKFVGVKVDALVINYNPTPENDPVAVYKEYCRNPDYSKYVVCCPTNKDMSGYNKLKKVKFGVVMVRGAAHNFLYSEGKTYEVHRDSEGGPSLYEQKDLLHYDWILDWRDGIIIVPPDNGVFQ